MSKSNFLCTDPDVKALVLKLLELDVNQIEQTWRDSEAQFVRENRDERSIKICKLIFNTVIRVKRQDAAEEEALCRI